jgi:hypothetical protein
MKVTDYSWKLNATDGSGLHLDSDGDGCRGVVRTRFGFVEVTANRYSWLFGMVHKGRLRQRIFWSRPGWMSRLAIVRAAAKYAREIAGGAA